jgi:hypothetical protein
MKYPLLRILGAGVVVIGLVWLGYRAGPQGGSGAGQEVGQAWTLGGEIRRGEQLQASEKLIGWGIATKRALAAELVAGRLTLFEAAAGLAAVEETRARFLQPGLSLSPAKTPAEKLCREMIALVRERLRGSQEQATVVGRLETELREHLTRHDTMQLPEFRRPESIAWFAP